MTAGDSGGNRPEKQPRARRSLAGKAEDEPDPEWKRWFQEIDRRRKALTDPKRQPVKVSQVDKDGKKEAIARRKSTPTPIRKFLKVERKHSGTNNLETDMVLIRAAWYEAVGEELVKECAIHSFKNGTLTVEVKSAALLQEIRQFHKESLIEDLRDNWKASIPLLKVVFKAGKR